MNSFQLSKTYKVLCRSENTRYGFRHLAELQQNGSTIAKSKACYYNRTWESYEFQSVIHSVVNGHFTKKEAKKYNKKADEIGLGKVDSLFKSVGTVALLGETFCDNEEDKNKWKKRMLKAGLPALDFPKDFDTLSEEEKKKRLDKVIELTRDRKKH